MKPRLFLGSGRHFPAYRTLGTVGGIVAIAFVMALGRVAERPVAEVFVVVITAPLAFLFAVKLSVLVFGYERIVFYEKTVFVLVVTALVLHALGRPVGYGLDLSTIGIGVFLVFGRCGCYMVACCYGCPSRRGVRYGDEHARVGFPRWLVGRSLVPLQLIDAAVSAIAVSVAVIAWLTPVPAGHAAAAYLVCYGLGRFVEERFRFDAVRPRWLRASEAQWTALAIAWLLVALVGASWWTLGNAAALTLAFVLVAARPRGLTDAWHTAELARELRALELNKVPRAVTSLGVHATFARLDSPDGPVRDYLVSAPTAATPLTQADVMQLAAAVGLDQASIRLGATPGLFHILVSSTARRAS